MFDFVGRCFQIDIFGFCSRKGDAKYVDFGAEDKGKTGVGLPIKDPEWDADIDALTEMEYNLVAEQPKGIKLELQDPESFDSPRDYESKDKPKNEIEESGKIEQQTMDVVNHNELQDLISSETENDES